MTRKIKSQARRRKAPYQPVKPSIDASRSFPIVGVGASAGGLEAFMEMFRTLPPDTGLAFVLVQHLSPRHISMLSMFVQKATQMQVEEVKDGVRVEPNRVYVIPPRESFICWSPPGTFPENMTNPPWRS